jgi:choice-of-anchor B domain-containing protein
MIVFKALGAAGGPASLPAMNVLGRDFDMTGRGMRMLVLVGMALAVLAMLASAAAGATPGAAAPVAARQGRAQLPAGTPGPDGFPSHVQIVDGPAKQAPAVATPCVGGFAGIYPCNGIDLMSNIPLNGFPTNPTSASDLWGYVDLDDMREYALIGISNGIAVVNITDPVNPVIVGTIPMASSSWHEVRVYQFYNNAMSRWDGYAYAVTDQAGTDGVKIIDLTNLPNSVSLANTYLGPNWSHTIHVSNINWSTGVANNPSFPPNIYLNGSSGGSGFRILSLANPTNLSQVGQWSVGTYTHDIYTHVFTDTRVNQCAPGHNPCEVAFSFSGTSGLKIVDVTDKASTLLLSTLAYSQLGYTHSGWISSDGQYLFLHDELDEQNYGFNTRVRTINITNLTAPFVSHDYYGTTTAIDHNGYTVGNKYYFSNYTRGISVLNATNPNAESEIGFFDTYPTNNNASFAGAWGVYPFLPSGNIIISDINRGLFVVREQNLATPTPTNTATPGPSPTPTRTLTPSLTPTVTPTTCGSAGNYATANVSGTIVPGVTDIGNHCDDCTTSITFPFPVTVYDQVYTSANVSSNGNLQFVSSDTAYSNVCLPDATHDTTIYPYWDDLYTVNSGYGIYTTVLGSAPNRTFVIEWRDQYYPGSGTANFEVLLHENTPNFEIVYGTITNGNTSATAGVQRDTGSRFTQYFCNGTGGASTGQVNYTLPSCGTATPTVTPGGPTFTPTATNTPVPPTATNTPAPATATSTPAPPTATDTPVPPTATATSAPLYLVYGPLLAYNAVAP